MGLGGELGGDWSWRVWGFGAEGALAPKKVFIASLWLLDFPGGASGKEPGCQRRTCKRPGFDPWVGKIPWRRIYIHIYIYTHTHTKKFTQHIFKASLHLHFIRDSNTVRLFH